MQLALLSLAALSFTVGGIFMKRADGIRHATARVLFLLLFMFGAAIQSHVHSADAQDPPAAQRPRVS